MLLIAHLHEAVADLRVYVRVAQALQRTRGLPAQRVDAGIAALRNRPGTWFCGRPKAIVRATRVFARRQRTWLREQNVTYVRT